MKNSLDPIRRDLIDVATFALRYGNKLDRLGMHNPRPKTQCPFCFHTMHTAGENDGWTTDAIFVHDRGTLSHPAPWCVSKLPASWKYEGLTPTHPEWERARWLRNCFMSRWDSHWALIRRTVSLPDIFMFIRLIEFFDKNKIWAHRGLEEHMIPYIMLSLTEFPPVKNAMNQRNLTIRFRFTGQVRGIDDLWNKSIGVIQIMPAYFKTPEPPKRVATELICVGNPISISKDYLLNQERDHYFPSNYQIDQFNKRFGT